jgi:hypothetical protein
VGSVVFELKKIKCMGAIHLNINVAGPLVKRGKRFRDGRQQRHFFGYPCRVANGRGLVSSSNLDVDVATGNDGFWVRALNDLSRCRWRKKRSLAVDAWLKALDLLDGTSEGQLEEVLHIFFKLSDRLLALS